jgi:hypothetical protein
MSEPRMSEALHLQTVVDGVQVLLTCYRPETKFAETSWRVITKWPNTHRTHYSRHFDTQGQAQEFYDERVRALSHGEKLPE